MRFNSSVSQAISSIHTPQSASPPPGSVIPSSTSTTSLNKSLLDLLCTPTKHQQSSQPQTSQPSTPFAVSSSNQNYLIYSTLHSEGVSNGTTNKVEEHTFNTEDGKRNERISLKEGEDALKKSLLFLEQNGDELEVKAEDMAAVRRVISQIARRIF